MSTGAFRKQQNSRCIELDVLNNAIDDGVKIGFEKAYEVQAARIALALKQSLGETPRSMRILNRNLGQLQDELETHWVNLDKVVTLKNKVYNPVDVYVKIHGPFKASGRTRAPGW
jgi:hypothetical protein